MRHAQTVNLAGANLILVVNQLQERVLSSLG